MTSALRNHYEGVALATARALWKRKGLVSTLILLGVALAAGALIISGPRYTSEAMIQLSFTREESASGNKVQPIAAVDALALVDRAARMIRAQSTASAVVSRLQLDDDPEFARESVLWRMLLDARALLGLERERASPHDLAVSRLLRGIRITHEPRSYVISVSASAGNPDQAATLANAFALEYLWGEALQYSSEMQAAAERDLRQIATVYGERHPTYVLARTKRDRWLAQERSLRDKPFGEDGAKLAIGHVMVAAQSNGVPSGPNIFAILGATAIVLFVIGTAVALSLEGWPNLRPAAAMGDESVHEATPMPPILTNGRGDGAANSIEHLAR
jgi:hypothetical protein